MSGLLDLICVGNFFETFDEVEQLVSRLREELCFPIKFIERRTAASHNKKVNYYFNMTILFDYIDIYVSMCDTEG